MNIRYVGLRSFLFKFSQFIYLLLSSEMPSLNSSLKYIYSICIFLNFPCFCILQVYSLKVYFLFSVLLTKHIHFSVYKEQITTIHLMCSLLPQITRHQSTFFLVGLQYSINVAQLIQHNYAISILLLQTAHVRSTHDSYLGSVLWAQWKDIKFSLG